MKKHFISMSLILAFLNLTVAPVLAGQPIVVKLGKQDDREVKNFNGIVAGGPIHVVITLGNTENLRFEGDAAAIATLVTEVKGNILIIRPQTSWTSWKHKYENKKITAYVNAKTIQSLTMSGEGSMTVKGKITVSDLAITLSGSGNLMATADVDDLTAVLSGSGKMIVSGKAKNASITLSGSSIFTEKSFTLENLTALISGSGLINVTAKKSINATISGSGAINYSGNATVRKTIIGSGKINKI